MEALFADIPDTPPMELTRLEETYNRLQDEETARDEFISMSTHSPSFPHNKASLPINATKNRYINIMPFDETRVVLSTIGKKEGTDYINANYIQGFNQNNEYIAAQGPLPQTVNDFWRMIWENECSTIVMVTNPVEGGNVKCEVYWPEENHSAQYSNISVTTIKELIRPSFTTRSFVLATAQKSTASSREVISRNCTQYHFTTWPDMGVPNDPVTMLRFVRTVRSGITNDKPVVVHCSAGVGRTGTFIALDILLQRMVVHNNVNVEQLIQQMRAQRSNMVQTPSQYVFIYGCLLYEFVYGETTIPKHKLADHYEKLQEAFPDSEDSRLDKEYEGSQAIIMPDESLLESANDNMDKNRLGAGLPLEFNRVCLHDPHEPEEGYINASFIGCMSRRPEYIIAQHPLKDTIKDHWRMILERNINTIVIIGSADEQLSDDEGVYWGGDKELVFDDISVNLTDTYEDNNVKITGLEVECEITEEFQSVVIFQLMDWPKNDKIGVPSTPKSMLTLIERVSEHSTGLIVVHTAASVNEEASGVFCVLYSLIPYLKEAGQVNVMETVKRTVQQRPGCISSKDQYEYIYEVLIASMN